MQSARAAIALLAVLAIDAPAQDATAPFVVDVELSQASASNYVAQFRVRDAATHRVIAERAMTYAGGPGGLAVAAAPARSCTSGGAHGFCVELSVGTGADLRHTQAFIPRDSHARLASVRFDR